MRILLALLFMFSPLLAQQEVRVPHGSPESNLVLPGGAMQSDYPDVTTQAVVLIFVALLPFMIMLLTSFMKMVITLALLRSALGVQQSPPNQVINGIALILTIYVMYPTGYQMYESSKDIITHKEQPDKLFSGDTANMALAIVNRAKEPLRDFLIRNANKKHIDGFFKIADKTFPDEVKKFLTKRDYIVIVPAFITTQIKAAFEIGVLIYLPFFVIDLVTSNILLAMQMMMLSPLSIALPLKLLLVVMIDGWTVLLEGLVLSFH
ncbi:MAG: Flagellar biosynthetic protein FliP [Chlamydiales bacterium]|nr:Flagellar biosynthetic protein FliP [Chlamydiales bacterium]MCH9636280.1 Flagellar biosynthetic protein FliP [Chlamydiales bacterium]MCH9703163.1 type III secretion system export apparatus subunit SctR [Chlamydiota bacterium]